MKAKKTIGELLSKNVGCKVFWDKDTLNFYSVDASSYVLKPTAVAFPRNESDVSKIIQFASKNKIPLTPRGAGTGLVGSCLGKGIILDMKHLNKIQVGSNYVKVGSGVFKGELDKTLEKHGKFFGPNPSIGPFCTIGGMIATNASGSHSLKYGSMVDNLIEVKVATFSGKLVTLPKNNDVGKKIIALIPKKMEEDFPKVSKNSCGYRIDRIKTKKDLHKIIAGSEGTLGIIISAKLATFPTPKNLILFVLSYKTLIEAVKDVPRITELKPSAVELVDNNITKHIKIRLPVQTGCLIFVEFDDIKQPSKEAFEYIISGKIVKIVSEKNKIKEFWYFRNSALAYSLKSITKNETMPTLIEDATVPTRRLPLLLKMLGIIEKRHNFRTIVYGHAGNGNLHIRAILKKKDKTTIKKIACEFFSEVIKIGGCISGEHGDGLARSEFVKLQYGKKVHTVFKTIKSQLDPNNILNPGKIISNNSTVTKYLKV